MQNQTLIETICPDCRGEQFEHYFGDRDERGTFCNGDPCATCDGHGYVPAGPAGPERFDIAPEFDPPEHVPPQRGHRIKL